MLSFYTLSKKNIFCSYYEPLSFFNNCVINLKMDIKAEGRIIKQWGQLFFLGNKGNFSTSCGVRGIYVETADEVFCTAEEVLYYV